MNSIPAAAISCSGDWNIQILMPSMSYIDGGLWKPVFTNSCHYNVLGTSYPPIALPYFEDCRSISGPACPQSCMLEESRVDSWRPERQYRGNSLFQRWSMVVVKKASRFTACQSDMKITPGSLLHCGQQIVTRTNQE